MTHCGESPRRHLGRERVHDEVADERVVHRVAVVRAPEVRVAVVDLEVPTFSVMSFIRFSSGGSGIATCPSG